MLAPKTISDYTVGWPGKNGCAVHIETKNGLPFHRKASLTGVAQRRTERPGFEPGVRFYPYDGLANRYLQPLGHLSGYGSASSAIACAYGSCLRRDESE